MKKLFTIIVLLIAVQFANAQILNKVKQKAKQVANEAVSGNKTSARESNSGSGNNGGVVDQAVSSVAPKAKSDIIFSTTRGGAAKTEFGLNDNIYGRIMLEQPLQKVLYDLDQDQEPYILIPINLVFYERNAVHGEHVRIKILKEDYTKNYIDFDIIPAVDDIKSEYYLGENQWTITGPINYFGDAPSGGPEFGKQEFWVNFGPNNEYKGNFYFTVNNVRESNIVKKRIEELRVGMKSAAAKTTQLPDVFNKPSAKNADPQLSFANIKKMLDAPDFRVLKMVIEENGTADYYIKKNALDVPEYKITARPVWVVYKDDKGQCKFTRYYFQRQYEGGGKYGPLEIATTTADHTLIACENVK